ncbi:MAG: hypothetical protein FWD57_06570 [Polyangiaceae bacterium]|nr:hypothetical protein [Polyangiaceae bacterium]
MTALFPIFVNIEHCPVLVVGAGTVAARKVRLLIRSSAVVTVVAPRVCDEIRDFEMCSQIEVVNRKFQPSDIDGKRLVIVATGAPKINETIVQCCRERGVWVNTVDDPNGCDFHVPAVVQRGAIQVAISSGGTAPALSRILKEEIAAFLKPSLGAYAEIVADARCRIKAALANSGADERSKAMDTVLASDARSLVESGDEAGAWQLIDSLLDYVLFGAGDKRA